MIAKSILRTTALLLVLLFATMAYLQLDDDDSVIWMVCYGLAAIIALAVVFGLPARIPLIILAVAYTVWSLTLSDALTEWFANHPIAFITDEDSTKHVYMERSRECLGLAIVVVGTLWLLIVDTFNRR